ncbi:P-loop containing nucleoside triphosphate hydrolase protein [Rhodofomes roseus]|uniref:DNA 3'-5' helicase n=1 Tax=Rhodofomes roseus TaxID=34475 RepID=A0ABQ8K498_9APHY|nr:P-loop containing nucleoside triphosphate hydrolase protein [Rhodofomes roseus]KAH9831739.1 P-loop containing nucleoside triphosphate hydrolase protein [Rhodofomes roseus]
MAQSHSRPLPSLEEICATTLAKLSRDPCRWQARATQLVLERKNDLINIAPTGSGKTLTFWMPLLFREDGIQIVVTPLNILGTQNEQELASIGVRAIAIRAETATPQVFRDIAEGKYRVIVVNPEELMKDGGGFERLWKNSSFTSKIISIVFDEAHCISIWKSFRPDYKNIHRLRYILPNVPFVLATATLPDEMRREVMTTLQIRPDRCTVLRRSNDRPNVHIEVRRIQHAQSSFEDLDFLVLPKTERASGDPIPKLLVFFDNIEEIHWFHAQMSEQFREDDLGAFNSSKLYGLCSTDSFGMGVNIADIRIVVQWRLTCNLNTLWQRFGRAARDLSLDAVAVLLVEARYFDEEREKVKGCADKRAEKRKADLSAQKPAKKTRTQGPPPAAVTASSSTNVESETRHDDVRHAGDEQARATGGDHGVSGLPGQGSSQEPPISAGGVAQHVDLASLHAEFEAARAVTGRAAKRKHKQSVADASQLSPELDALVNAATRPFRCYRAPIMAYYRNDQIGKSVSSIWKGRLIRLTSTYLTEPDNPPCRPTGCSRCATRSPVVCCILCSPDAQCFKAIAPGECHTAARPDGASRIKKDMVISPAGRDLRTALNTFRRERTIEKYNKALLDALGPSVILPDNVLDHLVECAQAGKIKSATDLQREVGKKWGKVQEHGEAVIALIMRCVASVYQSPCHLIFG